jgi:regulatory protein
LQWLAQRDHSRRELREKLLRWQSDQAEQAQHAEHTEHAEHAQHASQCADAAADAATASVDELLDQLQAAGHLSDERFAESRVHARSARFGNRRIAQELRQHGAAPTQAAMEALKASELDRARAVWQKKFSTPAATAAERARQMRFLAGRGFTGDTIRLVLAGPGPDLDFEDDPGPTSAGPASAD